MVMTRKASDTAAQEKISQWMDGESGGSDFSAVRQILKSEEGREAWGVYHLIGDVLREGAECGAVAPDFNARMARALAAEPTVMVPATVRERSGEAHIPQPAYRAWALAAAVTGAAVIGWTTFAVQNEGSDAGQLASGGEPPGIMTTGAVIPVAAIEEQASVQMEGMSQYTPSLEAQVPVDYLTIHQEFSPSGSMWAGSNAYQRIEMQGHDLSQGQ